MQSIYPASLNSIYIMSRVFFAGQPSRQLHLFSFIDQSITLVNTTTSYTRTTLQFATNSFGSVGFLVLSYNSTLNKYYLEQLTSTGVLSLSLEVFPLYVGEAGPFYPVGFYGTNVYDNPETFDPLPLRLIFRNEGNDEGLQVRVWFNNSTNTLVNVNINTLEFTGVTEDTTFAQKPGCNIPNLINIVSVSQTPVPTPTRTPQITPTPTITQTRTPTKTPAPTQCVFGVQNQDNCIKSIKIELYHKPTPCNGGVAPADQPTLAALYQMKLNGNPVGSFGWSYYVYLGNNAEPVSGLQYTPLAPYYWNMNNQCETQEDCDFGNCCCNNQCDNGLFFIPPAGCCSGCRDEYHYGPFTSPTYFRYKNTRVFGNSFDLELCRWQNGYFPLQASWPNSGYEDTLGFDTSTGELGFIGDYYQLYMLSLDCAIGPTVNCISGPLTFNGGQCADIGYEVKLTGYPDNDALQPPVWTSSTCIAKGDRIFFNPCTGQIPWRTDDFWERFQL